jgi:predicted DCC family thiol-disulfide oxidoreductase YuxK
MTQTVVLYEGLCALCVQSVRWVKRVDWRQAITYTDLQDWTTVHARYPQLDRVSGGPTECENGACKLHSQ